MNPELNLIEACGRDFDCLQVRMDGENNIVGYAAYGRFCGPIEGITAYQALYGLWRETKKDK